MFDRFARARSPRWRTTAIVATTAGHAAVISAVIIAAFWKIDKVPVVDKGDVRFAVTTPQDEAGSPPAGTPLKTEEKPRRVPPPPDVQPPPKVEIPPPQHTETGSGQTGLGPPGGGGGGGEGPPDSTEIGEGKCGTPPCGEKPLPQQTKVEVVKEQPKKVEILPPNVAAGLRMSGNDALYPSDPVRLSIVRDGKEKVQGTFKVCVSPGGRVDKVDVVQSTGYSAYDSELTSAMRAWTFRPYMVNDEPAPMCTIKIVQFRLKR